MIHGEGHLEPVDGLLPLRAYEAGVVDEHIQSIKSIQKLPRRPPDVRQRREVRQDEMHSVVSRGSYNLSTRLLAAFRAAAKHHDLVPLPRQPERLLLWQRSCPAAAPVAQDIDWALLARCFELTGGVIRNAALGAAYLAAESGGPIGNAEIVNALRTELHKAGRRVQDSEFGALAALLAPRDRAAALMEE